MERTPPDFTYDLVRPREGNSRPPGRQVDSPGGGSRSAAATSRTSRLESPTWRERSGALSKALASARRPKRRADEWKPDTSRGFSMIQSGRRRTAEGLARSPRRERASPASLAAVSPPSPLCYRRPKSRPLSVLVFVSLSVCHLRCQAVSPFRFTGKPARLRKRPRQPGRSCGTSE